MGFLINPYLVQPSSAYDSDAQAFFTAAGITNTTQKSAVNQLVLDLKSYSIWTKMKALYPFVGGTATTHKYNLKDPQDTDAAFRLVFSGGWTHSSTGAKPNGSNAYADTKYNNQSNSQLNSSHLSYYSLTNTSGAEAEMGCYNSVLDAGYFMNFYFTPGNYKGLNAGSTNVGSAYIPTTGFLLGNRPNSTTEKYFHKGSLIDNLTKNSKQTINLNVFIGTHNFNGSPLSYYTQKECAFASIGDGLSDTEAANLYTAVQAFQTTLSRNI